jgi:hypothetical protein
MVRLEKVFIIMEVFIMVIIDKKERTEKMQTIYSEAKKFLEEITPSELQGKEMEKYFDVQMTFKTKNDILWRLLNSLQNRNMLPKVIGFENKDRKTIFKHILFDYDANIILNEYTADTLFLCFKENFNIKYTESKRSTWFGYAKSVISACIFINEFSSADDFNEFITRFTYNEFSSAALPLILEKEIYGFGFALACDFLKELGYTGYPKPDIHIKDILVAFNLCENNDYDAYKTVIEMANAVNETAYKVDKILWLIGSGRYYHHDIQIGRNKEKFIEKMKTKL